MAVSLKKRLEIYKRDGGKCQLCGANLSLDCNDRFYVQMDHIKPRSQGGKDGPENLRAVCKTCNSTRNRYSGEILKKKIIKDLRGANIQHRHLKRIFDDIEHDFITLNDLVDIQKEVERIYQLNMEGLRQAITISREKAVD